VNGGSAAVRVADRLNDAAAERRRFIFLSVNCADMYTYDTVVEAVKGLKQRGYDIDFNLVADRLHCAEPSLSLKADDFTITEFYRFEGESDPADEAVVYAIESAGGEKGLLVTGFGITAEGLGEEMIEKLRLKR
jgi:hypothetical protein